MTSLTRIATAALLAAIASAATAAPTTYAFDSVSRLDMAVRAQISITGILRDTTTPITVTWVDNVNNEAQYGVNRCVPVFLTMMEKAGRYYLNLTVDSASSSFGIVSCGLELRN